MSIASTTLPPIVARFGNVLLESADAGGVSLANAVYMESALPICPGSAGDELPELPRMTLSRLLSLALIARDLEM